jgi:hypothetical protein
VGRLKSRVRWPVVGAGLDRKQVVRSVVYYKRDWVSRELDGSGVRRVVDVA